jgi:hypothetical protein
MKTLPRGNDRIVSNRVTRATKFVFRVNSPYIALLLCIFNGYTKIYFFYLGQNNTMRHAIKMCQQHPGGVV